MTLEAPSEDNIKNYLLTLLNGGRDAINILEEIKGFENISTDELNAAYRAAADRLSASLELMGSEAGTIVDEYTAAIFKEAGATINNLGNG
jgi:hypothetical protein